MPLTIASEQPALPVADRRQQRKEHQSARPTLATVGEARKEVAATTVAAAVRMVAQVATEGEGKGAMRAERTARAAGWAVGRVAAREAAAEAETVVEVRAVAAEMAPGARAVVPGRVRLVVAAWAVVGRAQEFWDWVVAVDRARATVAASTGAVVVVLAGIAHGHSTNRRRTRRGLQERRRPR